VVAVMFYSVVDSPRTSSTIADKQCGGHISCLYCTTNRLMCTAWYINLVVMKERYCLRYEGGEKRLELRNDQWTSFLKIPLFFSSLPLPSLGGALICLLKCVCFAPSLASPQGKN